MSTDIVTVYFTCTDQIEAKSIATALLNERLIACANILGSVQSLYHWEGRLQQDSEVACIAKTSRHVVDSVISRITDLHSYDTPCVVVWPIEEGSSDYIRWVGDELR